MKNTNAWKRNSSGFTLIEVLMGILIFAVGMLALAKLQGNLLDELGEQALPQTTHPLDDPHPAPTQSPMGDPLQAPLPPEAQGY